MLRCTSVSDIPNILRIVDEKCDDESKTAKSAASVIDLPCNMYVLAFFNFINDR